MPSSIFKIQDKTLSTATSTVEFSNIPLIYNDLMIKISCRTTAAIDNEYFNLRMNNDNGSVYYKYTSYSNGAASFGSQVWANETSMYVYQVVGDNAVPNSFSNHELYIPNYAITTTNKTVLEDSCSLDNDTTSNSLRMVTTSSMLWRPATKAAITTLTFTTASGNFKIGSSFTLYGVTK
jgi:hypothetical protein